MTCKKATYKNHKGTRRVTYDMSRNMLLMGFIALILFSSARMADSKNQWTDQESIRFAEDLFFLVETITKDTGPDSRVSLESYTIHGGTIRIMEFRFPDDRIISIRIHRNVAEEDSAWLEPISPMRSFFEKGSGKQPAGRP